MSPELDCYEERCRLTAGAVPGLAASLVSVGLGLLWHTPAAFAALAVILAALTTAAAVWGRDRCCSPYDCLPR